MFEHSILIGLVNFTLIIFHWHGEGKITKPHQNIEEICYLNEKEMRDIYIECKQIYIIILNQEEEKFEMVS